MGRFLNADDVSFINANNTPLSNNLYAYCENEPVNYIDSNGYYVGSLVVSSSIISSLSSALYGIMTGISSSIASIKVAIATSWVIAVCISAIAVAIGGVIYTVNRLKYLSNSAAKTVSAVNSKAQSNGINPNNLGNYTVYVIVRRSSIDVVYVGITKNYSSRKRNHTGKGKRFSSNKYKMMPIATYLTRNQARALEQTIISAYTLDTLKNMINSISPKKWSRFTTEFEQMKTLIASWIDPE